jgi:hypothetical protein
MRCPSKAVSVSLSQSARLGNSLVSILLQHAMPLSHTSLACMLFDVGSEGWRGEERPRRARSERNLEMCLVQQK